MVFSKDDLSLIKILRQETQYGAKRYLTEFPYRYYCLTALNRLIATIDATGSAAKRHGGDRPRTARTMENVDSFETLVLCQEDRPGTHRTIRQVFRETGNRLLRTCSNFSKSVMVSVGVSSLGCTELIFFNPGVNCG